MNYLQKKLPLIGIILLCLALIGCPQLNSTLQQGTGGTNGGDPSDKIEVEYLPFITVWNIPAKSIEVINLPFTKLDQTITIDWGNGVVEKTNLVGATEYRIDNSAGTEPLILEVIIQVSPDAYGRSATLDLSHWSFDKKEISKDLLVDIKQWGSTLLKDSYGAFRDCDNLVSFSATDAPTLEGSMDRMFQDTAQFTGAGIEHWDTLEVTNMSMVFNNAQQFNANITGWKVDNVTDMSRLFYEAKKFNQPIGGWNVSNVENMSSMFKSAETFNQDVSSWDVSKVTNMHLMFFLATAFQNGNNPLHWGEKTAQVTTMYGMFRSMNFNQDISDWNVSNVEEMLYMFQNNPNFNQDLSNWNVRREAEADGKLDAYALFANASSFNQDMSGWTNWTKNTTTGTRYSGWLMGTKMQLDGNTGFLPPGFTDFTGN